MYLLILKEDKEKQRRVEIAELKRQYTLSAMEKLTPEEKWALGCANSSMPKSLKYLNTLE